MNAAWQQLTSKIRPNHLPHALLLLGEESQTFELAQTFVQGLLCHQANDFLACGVCSSCLLFGANNHPDYALATPSDKSEVIGIEEVRRINEFCEQTPQCGSCKIIVIPKTHHMNIAASNALLKTLEEPQGNTYFILTSSLLIKIPATIRSRCQLIQFAMSAPLIPEWQAAFHTDCAALVKGGLDPLMMAQKWQKEDLLELLAQMEIYFVKRNGFEALDKITALRKITLQHGNINPLLQLEALLIALI